MLLLFIAAILGIVIGFILISGGDEVEEGDVDELLEEWDLQDQLEELVEEEN